MDGQGDSYIPPQKTLFAGGIKTNSTTLIEQLQNEKQTVPHLWNSSKMKKTNSTTLMEQLQNKKKQTVPHLWNSSKMKSKQYHTYGTAPK